jgi:hypothetical protein
MLLLEILLRCNRSIGNCADPYSYCWKKNRATSLLLKAELSRILTVEIALRLWETALSYIFTVRNIAWAAFLLLETALCWILQYTEKKPCENHLNNGAKSRLSWGHNFPAPSPDLSRSIFRTFRLPLCLFVHRHCLHRNIDRLLFIVKRTEPHLYHWKKHWATSLLLETAMSHALVILNRNEPFSRCNKQAELTVRETALSYISADKNSNESPQPYHWKQCWATFLQIQTCSATETMLSRSSCCSKQQRATFLML